MKIHRVHANFIFASTRKSQVYFRNKKVRTWMLKIMQILFLQAREIHMVTQETRKREPGFWKACKFCFCKHEKITRLLEKKETERTWILKSMQISFLQSRENSHGYSRNKKDRTWILKSMHILFLQAREIHSVSSELAKACKFCFCKQKKFTRWVEN